MREESLIMIDLMACLEDKHVNYVVGKDENKKDIYEKFVHSLKLLEQLDSLLANKHYVFKGAHLYFCYLNQHQDSQLILIFAWKNLNSKTKKL